MGGVKEAMLEAEERGYDVDRDILVCENCFEDGALQEYILSNGTDGKCSFCEEFAKPVTCELFEVLSVILQGISTEWGHPANEGLAYETREGGWQGKVYDTWNMLDSVGLATNTVRLFQTIAESIIAGEWCRRNPYALERHQTLLVGWRRFSQFVMNEARYLFLQATPSGYDSYQHDEIHPVAILEHLASAACDLELLSSLPQGSEILRVRIVAPDINLSSASELGTSPVDCASIPNRMSPAGIPMFYGAFDAQTAVAETYDPTRPGTKKAVLGIFRVERELLLLDLSRSISLPSIFDLEAGHTRHLIRFINEFSRDIASPVSRDDRSHIDYVPTQVVTEYFRHIFKIGDDGKLDGIIYQSSKNSGEPAVVIFADNEQCVDLSNTTSADVLLRLVKVEHVQLQVQIKST